MAKLFKTVETADTYFSDKIVSTDNLPKSLQGTKEGKKAVADYNKRVKSVDSAVKKRLKADGTARLTEEELNTINASPYESVTVSRETTLRQKKARGGYTERWNKARKGK